MAEQFIHYKATHETTMKSVYLTFVYGANQEGQRRALWDALKNIAKDMEEAWCILWDFNSILHPGDRIGGINIQDAEVRQFKECIRVCDIQELQSRGPYFSWTNKTVWTRIDRVFVNVYWYDLFGFSQEIYMANSLSDHTTMLQQKERVLRDNYIRILSSVIDILRQQCKAEWIIYGDDCTRYFFAKSKQIKIASYIFELQDEQGKVNQGFPILATIMQNYYKRLLGKQDIQRSHVDPQVIYMGNTLTLE
ncbi:hypothetical protein Cgig2_021729 [Carnegiea gigantea]|uniref:Endonuclease/exonuclease/phosphatase domain-containing protein n=1 Tax=Carnegiea gigantea TaxID=171969 RepID=A0A9Q1Q684_9CARY|nr:hypothetical protein Cgig2_021729 [Carnegiea gigantea]